MRLFFFKIFFFLIFFSCINISYSVEVLGTGTAALIGGDLTDPEDDGVDGAHTNWNWTSISASSEEKWTSEGSFNVFDNKVGSTNNKWCCNGPTQWISVGFSQPYILSHFTITSGNDVAGRDPDIWKIQGSNDGSNWTDIFVYDNNDTSPWGADRNTVLKYNGDGDDFNTPNAFSYFRYYVTSTVSSLHQINELEYFGTADSTNPSLTSSVPADNATGVAEDANIVLNFDEIVDAETGNITIKKTSDNSTVETIDVTGGQLSGSGSNQITLDPSITLDSSTEHYVLIDATAFDDVSGNSYAGISSTTALSFTTGDTIGPTLTSSVPADNATGVAVDSTIVLNFSESVDAESGNITIKKTSDNSTVETIDVTGGQVTGSGTSQITVTPSSDFYNDTEYYVLIDATAFDDASANSYAGISSTTALSFTTALEDPTNDKDVIGLMEVQTEAPKKIISRATSPIYNRLNWIRAYNLDDKLLAQKINLKFNDPKLNELSELISQSTSTTKPVKKITDSWLFWSEGSVGTGTVDATSKSSKKDIDTNAVTLGMDKKINNQSVHGYAITYIQEDAKVGDKGTSSEIDSYSISLYRAFSQGNNNYFEGVLGLSELDIKNIRKSGNNTLTGSRNGKQIFGSLQAINTFKNKQTEVSPNVRLDLGYTILDAYSEKGTNPLKYDEQTVETVGIYGGFNLSNEITKEDYIFRRSVALELGYDLSPNSDVSLNYVSDPNTKYTKSIDQEDDKSIKGKFGFDVVNDTGPSMKFLYERVENEDNHSDTLYFTVGYVTHRNDEFDLGLIDQNATASYKKNIDGIDIKFDSGYELFTENPDYEFNLKLTSKF
ncbi:Ig-like domain-containing protein [Candidatus Pelagibacter sp.]|nr:Ig-like domain-containing protein [Candidatus Pelagibacter sp.]